jgi:hypothetical protein
MKCRGFFVLAWALALLPTSRAADEFFDQIDDALTVSAFDAQVRARLSGVVDVENYWIQRPPPGLIFSNHTRVFTPRLTLFFDAQLGPHLYLFTQIRFDRGFDPTDAGTRRRFDEYALIYTPWTERRFQIEVGKFATVFGTWARRHGSWENPFVTAPLAYDNLMGIWDTEAAVSTDEILGWAHIGAGYPGDEYADKRKRLPIIWGPSYASGASISGEVGKMQYAFEVKNTALSSRPRTWDVAETQWQNPTWSGRVGYAPGPMWNMGVSASQGTYLKPLATSTVWRRTQLDDYRQIVFGQDASFAWHHIQLWAEIFEARFKVPHVGNADTISYYLEGKYKFAPQFSGALRWNQQVFGTLPEPAGAVRWGRNTWRIDAAPEYRLTPHTQLKVQYSLQRETSAPRAYNHSVAAQFTLRF